MVFSFIPDPGVIIRGMKSWFDSESESDSVSFGFGVWDSLNCLTVVKSSFRDWRDADAVGPPPLIIVNT